MLILIAIQAASIIHPLLTHWSRAVYTRCLMLTGGIVHYMYWMDQFTQNYGAMFSARAHYGRNGRTLAFQLPHITISTTVPNSIPAYHYLNSHYAQSAVCSPSPLVGSRVFQRPRFRGLKFSVICCQSDTKGHNSSMRLNHCLVNGRIRVQWTELPLLLSTISPRVTPHLCLLGINLLLIILTFMASSMHGLRRWLF